MCTCLFLHSEIKHIVCLYASCYLLKVSTNHTSKHNGSYCKVSKASIGKIGGRMEGWKEWFESNLGVWFDWFYFDFNLKPVSNAGREHNKTQYIRTDVQKREKTRYNYNANTAKQLQHRHAERITHTQNNHKIYTCIKINKSSLFYLAGSFMNWKKFYTAACKVYACNLACIQIKETEVYLSSTCIFNLEKFTYFGLLCDWCFEVVVSASLCHIG